MTETVRRKVSYPRFDGYHQEAHHVVRNLSLGELKITNAQIVVVDKPYYGEDYLLMGMAPFRDRTIVLDFKRMKLWVHR